MGTCGCGATQVVTVSLARRTLTSCPVLAFQMKMDPPSEPEHTKSLCSQSETPAEHPSLAYVLRACPSCHLTGQQGPSLPGKILKLSLTRPHMQMFISC